MSKKLDMFRPLKLRSAKTGADTRHPDKSDEHWEAVWARLRNEGRVEVPYVAPFAARASSLYRAEESYAAGHAFRRPTAYTESAGE